MTQKTTELVSSGITDTGEVKRHLRFYVTKTVPKELGIHPKPNNRAFHPTTVDTCGQQRRHWSSVKLTRKMCNVKLKIGNNQPPIYPSSSGPTSRTRMLRLPKLFLKGSPLHQTLELCTDNTMGIVGQKTMVSTLLDQMTTALRHF